MMPGSTTAQIQPTPSTHRVPKLAVRNRESTEDDRITPVSSNTNSGAQSSASNSQTSSAASSSQSIRSNEHYQYHPRSSDRDSRISSVRPESLCAEHARAKKKRGGVMRFLSLKEPSTAAWEQFAQEQRKLNANAKPKPTGLPGAGMISTQKLPNHVPPVNSKWDGLPDPARKKLQDMQANAQRPSSKGTGSLKTTGSKDAVARSRGSSSASVAPRSLKSSGRSVSSDDTQVTKIRIGSLTSRPAENGSQLTIRDLRASAAAPIQVSELHRASALAPTPVSELHRRISVRSTHTIDTHKIAILVDPPPNPSDFPSASPPIPERSPLRNSRNPQELDSARRQITLRPATPAELDAMASEKPLVYELDASGYDIAEMDAYDSALASLEGTDSATGLPAELPVRSSRNISRAGSRRSQRSFRAELDGVEIRPEVYELAGSIYVPASDSEPSDDEIEENVPTTPPTLERDSLVDPMLGRIIHHSRSNSENAASHVSRVQESDPHEHLSSSPKPSVPTLIFRHPASRHVDDPISPVTGEEAEAEASDQPKRLPNFSRPRPLSNLQRWPSITSRTSRDSTISTGPARTWSNASRTTDNTTALASPTFSTTFSSAMSDSTRPSTAASTPTYGQSMPTLSPVVSKRSSIVESSYGGADGRKREDEEDQQREYSDPSSDDASVISERWKLPPQQRLGLGAHIKKDEGFSGFTWELPKSGGATSSGSNSSPVVNHSGSSTPAYGDENGADTGSGGKVRRRASKRLSQVFGIAK
ncbi:hypothetical protein K431DRAFT_287912 [Polychaeton citri CBS 116435]|uniref:Uncharacterized protein n=1 Tax=Polychaeton citri CBS 116435 TaxID=1314669 RepID=A0A9P4Q2I7_9PEZI|nr:hypothetical protein K431DRAFT_287912 [Polychaeton citri CBS 116435]